MWLSPASGQGCSRRDSRLAAKALWLAGAASWAYAVEGEVVEAADVVAAVAFSSWAGGWH